MRFNSGFKGLIYNFIIRIY